MNLFWNYVAEKRLGLNDIFRNRAESGGLLRQGQLVMKSIDHLL
jgi:hypothetical protein